MAAGAVAEGAAEEPCAKRSRLAGPCEAVEAGAGREASAPKEAEGSAAGAAAPPAEARGALPQRLEVSGAAELGFNQTYSLVSSSCLREAHLARTGASLRPWAAAGAGDWAYQGGASFDDTHGPPFLWCQRWPSGAVQWKLAIPGEQHSTYGSHPERGRTFPKSLLKWRHLSSGRHLFNLSARALNEENGSQVQPAEPHGAASPDGACPAPSPACPCPGSRAFPVAHPDDPPELPSLGTEEAEEFHRAGYLVLRASAIGTARRAARARRAMALVLGELAKAALMQRPPGSELELSRKVEWDGLSSIRVRSRKEYAELLAPLRLLLTQMLGDEPELPATCQLAFGTPDGGLGEDFEGRGEERPDEEYHIDGRGAIPNGFALLVGVALSSPPEGSRSWGAFAVYPGSHRNSELHARYPLQKRQASAGGRFALGPPLPLRLELGDVVVAHSLLAHRRSQNWTPDIRYQLYFRLRPRRAASDPAWEQGLPADPFAVLPGVLAAQASAA